MAAPREQLQRVRRMSEAGYAATVVIVNEDRKKDASKAVASAFSRPRRAEVIARLRRRWTRAG